MSDVEFHHNNSVPVVPIWMKVMSFFRWMFLLCFLVSLNLPVWASIIIACGYVLVDRFVVGLAEKALIVLSFITLIISIVKYGLFSWFSLAFLLFVAWYIISFILSSRWLKTHINSIVQTKE